MDTQCDAFRPDQTFKVIITAYFREMAGHGEKKKKEKLRLHHGVRLSSLI